MTATRDPKPGEKWRAKRLPESTADVTRVGRELHTNRKICTLRWSNGHEETVCLDKAFREAWEPVP